MIPYGHQSISEEDIQSVVEVLRSDFLTQGPTIQQFEQAVAHHVHAKHAVAVHSATAALHIACLALGLQKGDLLWTVPNTFVASANCARYCGADVDFVDIDPIFWNISISQLRDKLAQAEKIGRLPKIVIPVHFAGQPTEQEAIWDLAQTYGFHIIEDASHAIGASRHQERVGSCRWSDITVFSFHPVKIITTGEGGMALTNSEELAWRMEMLRSHGITRQSSQFLNPMQGSWHYEQQMLGFNYRMTDIQAALGISQLKKLDTFIAKRNELAQRYHNELKGLPLRLPTIAPENLSAFHLYVVRLQKEQTSKIHQEIFDTLRSQGIGVQLHYQPVHLNPYYQNLGFKKGDFPESEQHGHEAVTLPLFPDLVEKTHDMIIHFIYETLQY